MSAHNTLEELNKEAEISHDGKIFDYGNDLPSDSQPGYAHGAIFIDTNASGTTAIYCNIGTATSSNWNLVTVAGD